MPTNYKKALVWDGVGERHYQTGVQKVVLYLAANGAYSNGVAWNGVTGIDEKATGGEANPLWADDRKYLNLYSVEETEGTITAYYYPDEWNGCDGNVELAPGIVISGQPRKTFGLCYRTAIGNDVDGVDHGYKLHLLYGATASPTDKNFESMNNDPNAMEMSWDYTTVPVEVEGHKPTALITVDSTKFTAEKMAALELILYGKNPTTESGTDGVAPRLPLPSEVASILSGT